MSGRVEEGKVRGVESCALSTARRGLDIFFRRLGNHWKV